jgi:hypothetical protein
MQKGGKVNYSPEKRNDDMSASLQQYHTHFVLVRSEPGNWGDEIPYVHSFPIPLNFIK